MKFNTLTVRNRLSAMTLLMAAGLFLCPTARAKTGQIAWILDSTVGLDVQIVGTFSEGLPVSIRCESPSGLWTVNYNFSVGFAGYDSKGDELYRLNVGSGRETYWNRDFFFEAGWGELSTLPLTGGEYLDTNSFAGAPGSLWSANSRISVSVDPNDSSVLEYTIRFLANGPALPNLPGGSTTSVK